MISYGILVFLMLLAPTSSFVPIKMLVERRLYLPSIGLLLVLADLLRRWKSSRAQTAGTMAAVLLAAGACLQPQQGVVQRNGALGRRHSKSPKNWRAHFQLAYAYYDGQRCSEAVDQYAKAAALDQSDVRLFVGWALAYDCAGRPADALEKLQKAATMEKSALVYSQIGMIYGKQGKRDEALRRLRQPKSCNQISHHSTSNAAMYSSPTARTHELPPSSGARSSWTHQWTWPGGRFKWRSSA